MKQCFTCSGILQRRVAGRRAQRADAKPLPSRGSARVAHEVAQAARELADTSLAFAYDREQGPTDRLVAVHRDRPRRVYPRRDEVVCQELRESQVRINSAEQWGRTSLVLLPNWRRRKQADKPPDSARPYCSECVEAGDFVEEQNCNPDDGQNYWFYVIPYGSRPVVEGEHERVESGPPVAG
jgi:hypothetical protein